MAGSNDLFVGFWVYVLYTWHFLAYVHMHVQYFTYTMYILNVSVYFKYMYIVQMYSTCLWTCSLSKCNCAGVFSKHSVHVHFYVNVRVHVLVHSRLFNHIFYMKTCIWPAANPILMRILDDALKTIEKMPQCRVIRWRLLRIKKWQEPSGTCQQLLLEALWYAAQQLHARKGWGCRDSQTNLACESLPIGYNQWNNTLTIEPLGKKCK